MVIVAKIEVLPALWRQMCQIAGSRMLLLCFMIIDVSPQVGRPPLCRVAAERSALDHNFSRKRATQVLLNGINECCGSASTQVTFTC
jgi:hypothetical protein